MCIRDRCWGCRACHLAVLCFKNFWNLFWFYLPFTNFQKCSHKYSDVYKRQASTLTQQLIKNNVFEAGGESNIIAKIKRKIQEQYLAINAEKTKPKEEILTDYLSLIHILPSALPFTFGIRSFMILPLSLPVGSVIPSSSSTD